MKALSLWEPWASCMAIGAKQIETRAWINSYRGPLAIHSAKTVVPDFDELISTAPFKSALSRHGYTRRQDFPFGKIVAIVDLVAVKQVVIGVPRDPNKFMVAPPDPEYSFGNYEAGRYGWITKNLRRVLEPIPAKGMQGLWEWPTKTCSYCGERGWVDSRCLGCQGLGIVPKETA